MNNALNAKLSKLIYALASDDPNYLAKAGVFDRLLLLIRELYQMLDESEGLKRLSLRLRYGKRYGMIALDAATPDEDAGALRLKRWMVYSRIAERIVGCGNDVSVALDDMAVENEEAKQRYIDAANEIIKRFVKVTRHIRRISTCQFRFLILPMPIVESLLHLCRTWHNFCYLKSLENLLQFSVIS